MANFFLFYFFFEFFTILYIFSHVEARHRSQKLFPPPHGHSFTQTPAAQTQTHGRALVLGAQTHADGETSASAHSHTKPVRAEPNRRECVVDLSFLLEREERMSWVWWWWGGGSGRAQTTDWIAGVHKAAFA